ncbi:MAG: hypothetical protein ACD_5C00104G0005, partial [uncultured bacterium]
MVIREMEIKNKKGFTLVEALIFSLIVVIVVVTFYRTFASGANVLRDAKARISASQVANEQFEILRNVAYENLESTEDGPIKNNKTIDRSSVSFNVVTNITYSNDDYDNPDQNDPSSDLKDGDYKHVEVIVSWLSGGETKKITMYSHIAPPGTEELYNGGILSINIISSAGIPVEGARVEIRDADTDALLHTTDTLDNGKVYLPGYAIGNNKYKIIVRKNGYYPVDTMPPYPVNSYEPIDLHGSVTLAGISSKTIYFDLAASLQLRTVDPLGNSIGNIDFSLEGGRILGNTGPVYSYVKTNHSSDAAGSFIFSDESFGEYTFEYLTSTNNDGYKFWKVEPSFGLKSTIFTANPGVVTDVNAILVPKDTPALFLRVVDYTDIPATMPPTPISDATVTVENESLSYE